MKIGKTGVGKPFKKGPNDEKSGFTFWQEFTYFYFDLCRT